MRVYILALRHGPAFKPFHLDNFTGGMGDSQRRQVGNLESQLMPTLVPEFESTKQSAQRHRVMNMVGSQISP